MPREARTEREKEIELKLRQQIIELSCKKECMHAKVSFSFGFFPVVILQRSSTTY
jgi:hypothetical protein